jgi:hypothetical protein
MRRSVTPAEAPRNETSSVTLRACLEGAAQGHVDLVADIEPIQALLDQGCDLELDILPVVAREVPELPRPLKKWGAPWLVREILAARDQRLAQSAYKAVVSHQEAPPPPRRAPPAIE